MALCSPLLDDVSIQGARGVLVNITGDEKMTLHEVSEATSIISEEAGDDANVIFGAVINESNRDHIHVTVIATGFDGKEREILPVFTAKTREPEVFEIPRFEEASYDGEHSYAGVGVEASGVTRSAAPNLDIPTFLRKQLD